MFFLGAAMGAALPINNAMWAELYGTRYLGEIKAMSTSLLVLSTALAPYLLGIFLDWGMNLSTLLIAGIIHAAIATLMTVPIARMTPFSRSTA